MRYVQYGINKEAYLLPRFGVSLLPVRGWTIRFGGGTYIQSPGFEKLIEPDNILMYQSLIMLIPYNLNNRNKSY